MSSVWSSVSEVAPSLYVSGFNAVTDENVASLGINLVVNASKDIPNFVSKAGSDVTVVRIPVHDNVEERLEPYLEPVASLIRANKENGGSTIVHCVCGVSRSVTLCMAYLMTNVESRRANTGFMGAYEALDHIKQRRSIASPNPAFMRQILRFESCRKFRLPLSDDERKALAEIERVRSRLSSK